MSNMHRNGKKIKSITYVDGIKESDGVSGAQYYIDIKNKKRSQAFLHSDLEPILKDDLGVFVYQESVMRFLVEIAGYSWEEADTIRSAIAKKKREVIMSTFTKIRESCLKRGWSQAAIETICQQILAFSSYSFNLSHSRAYAELGYITMWLKRNYPLEWWASELNNSNEKKMRHYIYLLGRSVIPPTLSSPSDRFTIVGKRIASPLGAVKGLGQATISAIVENGPYSSLEDFVNKTGGNKVNMGHVMALIRARALDCFMDPDLSYGEARLKLINEYCKIRKIKKNKISNSMFDVSPLNMFFQERDTCMTFNRTLVADPEIMSKIVETWKFIMPNPTGNRDIPFITNPTMFSRADMKKYNNTMPTPIVASVAAASRIIGGNVDKIECGFIGFFSSSSYKTGKSKKNGKDWHKLEVIVSDGQTEIECVMWDVKKPLRLPVNSIVLVRGDLKTGWRGEPQITISEIESMSDWVRDSKLPNIIKKV